jgi:hypothetical protein
MIWKPDSIIFQSAQGFVSLPFPQDSLIESWIYAGGDIPVPEKENIRINFWLIFGNAPLNGENTEFLINEFQFMPLPGVMRVDPDPVFDTSVLQSITLSQNYPNPFNPITKIEFVLPKSSEVSLRIYNILGEEVATLLSASLLSGSHQVEWDATGLSSGIYLYRLDAEGEVRTRKLILMK